MAPGPLGLMEVVARKLKDSDIQAVSEYYAGLSAARARTPAATQRRRRRHELLETLSPERPRIRHRGVRRPGCARSFNWGAGMQQLNNAGGFSQEQEVRSIKTFSRGALDATTHSHASRHSGCGSGVFLCSDHQSGAGSSAGRAGRSGFRCHPHGPARALLKIASEIPDAVAAVLATH